MKTIKYIILAIAYSVVIYYLVTYEHYTQLIASLRQWQATQWVMLSSVIALMPLNQLLEALKWRSIIYHIQPITITQAVKATLIGQVGAIATPNRIADFPTRTLILKPENRASATILGYLSGFTLTIVIGTAGTIAGILYLDKYNPTLFNTKYLTIAAATTAAIILLFALFPSTLRRILRHIPIPYTKLRRLIATLSRLKTRQTIIATAYSAIRYTLFSTQYLIILNTFGININPCEAIICIPTIYLLTTITPTITISEAAVRTSYAITILSPISQSIPAIGLATTSLWIINIGLPLLCGTLLFNLKNSAVNRISPE